MRQISLTRNVFATAILLAAAAPPVAGQGKAPPTISERQFTGGSIAVTVTGSFTMETVIPINTKASYGDGEMTWLQFGASGAAEPNALITYGTTGETGVSVAKGKLTATGGIIPGEKSECSGTVEVKAARIAGAYTCAGVTSHDPTSGMGTVDIKVKFTANS